MTGEVKPRRGAAGFREALARAGGAFLLLLLVTGGSPARASREPSSSRSLWAPSAPRVTVIPHGKREIRVSWTLRARQGGARVVLYSGTAVGNGVPIAQVLAGPGLSSWEFIDRSGRDGSWVYWLVVREDDSRDVVLGALGCVSPGLDGSPAPAPPDTRPALTTWPDTVLAVQVRTAGDEVPVLVDLFLKEPPAPPPEAPMLTGALT